MLKRRIETADRGWENDEMKERMRDRLLESSSWSWSADSVLVLSTHCDAMATSVCLLVLGDVTNQS